MDKQRDQLSDTSIPFSNSMMEDNAPDNPSIVGNMGERNARRADGDAGSTTFRTITPPRDPHEPPGDSAPDDAVGDFGVEGSEVGYNGTVAQYGLKGKRP